MEQTFKVAPESKGWLSPFPLSPRERKIGRGKVMLPLQRGLRGDTVKGRRWQESTGKMPKSWGFRESASQAGYRWGEGGGPRAEGKMAVRGGSWATGFRCSGNEGMGSQDVQWPQSCVDLPSNRRPTSVSVGAFHGTAGAGQMAPGTDRPPGTSQRSCSAPNLTPSPSLALSGSPK